MNWNGAGWTRDSHWTARVGVFMMNETLSEVRKRPGREILLRAGHWIP